MVPDTISPIKITKCRNQVTVFYRCETMLMPKPLLPDRPFKTSRLTIANLFLQNKKSKVFLSLTFHFSGSNLVNSAQKTYGNKELFQCLYNNSPG